MKIFIFIIYVLTLIFVPQIYTWAARESEDVGVVVWGGFITLAIVLLFTKGLVIWEILIFNF